MARLETFINLDHILSVDFYRVDEDITATIYYKEGESDKYTGNTAMKLYQLLVRKMTNGKANFIILDGESI